MALTLVIALAKTVPGSEPFTSIKASCEIHGEIAVGQDPSGEAAKLYSQAEAAVNRQLGLAGTLPAGSPVPAPAPQSASSPQSSPSSSSPVAYPSSGGRRAPAAISAAQLRFLRQLCDRTPGAIDRILAEHHVASIEALSSRAASAIIDQLKTAAP
jgi:hypothetical protein